VYVRVCIYEHMDVQVSEMDKGSERTGDYSLSGIDEQDAQVCMSMCVCVYIRMCACVCIRMCVCVCSSMCVCVCINHSVALMSRMLSRV